MRRSGAGFTLAELLISLAISSMMFAAIMSAGVTSMRSLAVAEDYSYESNEELRAIDFIGRDLRRALTVVIPYGGHSVTLTLPDYYSAYDTQGNPTGTPVTPTISYGAAIYGTADKPVTVTYAVVGKQLIRTQTIQKTGAVSTLVVCNNVNDFLPTFVQLSTTVTYTITFDPKFQTVSGALNAGTTLSATVSVRAIRFQ